MPLPARYPLLCLALLGATSVLAQGIYRHVGPDGRVTFSDQPPSSATSVAPVPVAAGPSAAPGAELPFTLRQVVQRYPVTLYTTDSGCSPCDRGRAMLRARGIPFTEKTVNTQQDLEAFQKLSSGGQFPHLTIGTQAVNGYTDERWHQYLDAAGYPKTSVLPRNYRAPAPTALVPVAATPQSQPEPPASEQPPVPPPAPARAVPSGPSPQNPAGIRF